MVSAVIIAEKIKTQIQENLKSLEKSDLTVLNPSGEYLVYLTIKNVLKLNIDECILMLHDNSDKILDFLRICNLDKDKRFKIITFPESMKLTEILFRGVNEVKSKYSLCICANQPLVSPETLK